MSENENTSVETASSKTEEVVKAKEVLNEAAVKAADDVDADRIARRKARLEAAKNIQTTIEPAMVARPQSRNMTTSGAIDLEAMGDVKGDGRDAKDYPDSDPDKHLGVPTYEHGLNDVSAGNNQDAALAERHISPRTQAELDAGKKALSGRRGVERDASEADASTEAADKAEERKRARAAKS